MSYAWSIAMEIGKKLDTTGLKPQGEFSQDFIKRIASIPQGSSTCFFFSEADRLLYLVDHSHVVRGKWKL